MERRFLDRRVSLRSSAFGAWPRVVAGKDLIDQLPERRHAPRALARLRVQGGGLLEFAQ